MGNAGMFHREWRFIIEPELLQVYCLIEAVGDCPLGVHGWHHKTFPASVPVIEVLHKYGQEGYDPVLWPLDAPPR